MTIYTRALYVNTNNVLFFFLKKYASPKHKVWNTELYNTNTPVQRVKKKTQPNTLLII